MNDTDITIYKSLKYNVAVNLLDGSFFGFAMGFASFVTILPLFVSTMTSSAVLIGLIPAIHSMGWQLPQLFTVETVARQRRYKPLVLLLTVQERLPFLGLALVAWLMPRLSISTALWITYALLVWQGLGGGITATAWQSMIGKIIPSDRRGSFFGAQSAAANFLASISAIFAGIILDRLDSPLDYVVCFLLASACMVVSWFFLAQTREPERAPQEFSAGGKEFWKELWRILQRDVNFRWFLVARVLSQVGIVAFSFYTVYAVHQHGMTELGVGVITSVYLASQIISNPLMGWIGDRFSHRLAMEIGIVAAVLSALLAWWAPSWQWFYLVFILAGLGNASVWIVSLAMILEFGTEVERPAYIGLGNTLVAPMTILAPLAGGWLADLAGYPAAFLASALGGIATLVVLFIWVRDPRQNAINLAPLPAPVLVPVEEPCPDE